MKLDAMKKEIEQLEKQAKVASGWKEIEASRHYRIELPEKEIHGIKVKPFGRVRQSYFRPRVNPHLGDWGTTVGLEIGMDKNKHEIMGAHGRESLRFLEIELKEFKSYDYDTLEEAKKAVEDALNSLK